MSAEPELLPWPPALLLAAVSLPLLTLLGATLGGLPPGQLLSREGLYWLLLAPGVPIAFGCGQLVVLFSMAVGFPPPALLFGPVLYAGAALTTLGAVLTLAAGLRRGGRGGGILFAFIATVVLVQAFFAAGFLVDP